MKDSIAGFYNTIRVFYPLINLFLLRQRIALIQEINSYPKGNLLEIGIGDGSHLPLYKLHQLTGIDISASMLEKAKQRNVDNANLLLMDGEALKFPDASYNYIVLSHILAVAGDPEKLLQEVHRVLIPGGTLFILNHFTPETWLSRIDKAFQPLSRLLHFRSYFKIEKIGGLQSFTLEKKEGFGLHDYFQLLIYSKP
ncbi:class I SAM-dependent methyltransferase [Flavihumibacter sp. UBA7668]|uniref:class I SAM-dependent methyltransferase n=1 Tax=Flavihumibacter sp. UBA7668 TaxID=1946542 RepID=UPI0025C46994|nr:class I SAM-dependent methyltransferase [Flavihumibacter sp. UBA7668]